MDNYSTNKIKFSEFSIEAANFYNENGWVVLSEQSSEQNMQNIKSIWKQLCNKYALDIGCDLSDYKSVISQWRDLWKVDPLFYKFLKDDIAPLASKSFQLEGSRLLHDHIICKTSEYANGEIPWHQDSMYWPVDRTGLSILTPLVDVPVKHGCLQVVSRTHLNNAEKPVDFMSAKNPFTNNEEIVLLPTQLGDMILLHSRTWHRSLPTKSQGERPVHIALWVPEQTNYHPDNADWHPLNERITVEKGELLNNDEFPIFGNSGTQLGNSFKNIHEGVPVHFGMFNAKETVLNQIKNYLNIDGNITELLEKKAIRENLLEKILAKNVNCTKDEIRKIIQDVWISGSAYEKHRSRNVFNSAYSKWHNMHKE